MTNVAQQFADTFTVRQVFGEPIERGGLTLVPVAKIAGGGGGGDDGLGFGGTAKPLGALVIDKGEVRWRPVLEPSRILAAAGIGLAALVLVSAVRRRRARKKRDR